MHYVIIGGDAAGMSAAMEIVRGDENAKITVLEKGEIYSYGQCGLPYIIDGRIPKTEDLIARSVETFRERYGMDARIFHEVNQVDVKQQQISGVTAAGEIFHIHYDKLLVATGASPVIPKIENYTLRGVHTVKTIPQMKELLLDLQDAKHAVVIGGGYIGLEVAEALAERGLHVRLVHRGGQLMKLLPEYMGDIILQQAKAQGMEVMLNCEVTALQGTNRVETALINGQLYPADVVIIATGVVPNTEWIDADKLKNGALIVNRQQQTSLPNIYAAGDCAAHYHRITKQSAHVPLGTTANKQGRIAGRAMLGQNVAFGGIVGTAVLKFFDIEIGTTGLTEAQAKKHGFAINVYQHQSKHHAGYYPGAQRINLVMVVEQKTNRLLGLQAVGKGVDKRIDVFATALYNEMTFEQLLELDLAYAPPFNGVWDPIQQLVKRNI